MRAAVSLIAVAFLGLVACQTSSVTPSPARMVPCARDVQPPALVPGESGGGSDVVAPVVIRRVEPIVNQSVPNRATAVVEAVIGEDGVPRNVCVTEGDPTWGRFLAAAVRQWRFRPGTLDGKPVPVLFSVTSTYNR